MDTAVMPSDASILDAICDDEALFRASLRVLARTDERIARALAERFIQRELERAFAS